MPILSVLLRELLRTVLLSIFTKTHLGCQGSALPFFQPRCAIVRSELRDSVGLTIFGNLHHRRRPVPFVNPKRVERRELRRCVGFAILGIALGFPCQALQNSIFQTRAPGIVHCFERICFTSHRHGLHSFPAGIEFLKSAAIRRLKELVYVKHLVKWSDILPDQEKCPCHGVLRQGVKGEVKEVIHLGQSFRIRMLLCQLQDVCISAQA
mmetsp:Transcript_32815/g.60031  ORF Transcript_32815/g.60031 Transcript_32815/m.60031 type:complete len:209 (-) Transcript_32815:352-978(-)